MKNLNNSLIVSERFYHSLLFKYKNEHPDLDIKIITPSELLDKISFSFKKDPIPFLVKEKNIEYTKANKWISLLRKGDYTKNNKLLEIYNLLKDDYLVYDEYGLLEISQRKIFLFEMLEDVTNKELLKRANLSYDDLTLIDLNIDSNKIFNDLKIRVFPNKNSQFEYIFADIRKRLLEHPEDKDNIVILIENDADLFYTNLYSNLLDISVITMIERPYFSVETIKNKVNLIYKTKCFNFTDEELKNNDLLTLKSFIDAYKLNELEFNFAYANLLEILDNHKIKEIVNNKGITLTNQFNLSPSKVIYITNFQNGSFYDVASDNDVLSDLELTKIGITPSYSKTELNRRKKLNYIKYNDIALFSRVEEHLTDAIYESQFEREFGWNKITGKVVKEETLTNGVVTSKMQPLLQSQQLDRQFICGPNGELNTYDHSFKGISEKEILKPRNDTWHITDIESYRDCPYKYYLEKMIPAIDEDYHAMCRGTLIHSVFEQLYHPDFDFEKAFEEGRKQYIQSYNSKSANENAYGAKEEAYIEVIKYWLKKIVESYRKINDHMTRVEPSDGQDSEKSIEFDLRDRDTSYHFRGRIDKILLTRNEDEIFYTIIDYKTGLETFEPEQVCLGKSIQLPLYYYAIENSEKKDSITDGAKFGGFAIQTNFFGSISQAYKNNNKDIMTEAELLKNGRFNGLFVNNNNYFKSIDDTIENNNKGLKDGCFVAVKDTSFTDLNSPDVTIVKPCTLDHYNLDDIVKDSKKAAIKNIKHILNNDFDIAPTSFPIYPFNSRSMSCDSCPYKDVCYRSSQDKVNYDRFVKRRFRDDPNWDDEI